MSITGILIQSYWILTDYLLLGLGPGCHHRRSGRLRRAGRAAAPTGVGGWKHGHRSAGNRAAPCCCRPSAAAVWSGAADRFRPTGTGRCGRGRPANRPDPRECGCGSGRGCASTRTPRGCSPPGTNSTCSWTVLGGRRLPSSGTSPESDRTPCRWWPAPVRWRTAPGTGIWTDWRRPAAGRTPSVQIWRSLSSSPLSAVSHPHRKPSLPVTVSSTAPMAVFPSSVLISLFFFFFFFSYSSSSSSVNSCADGIYSFLLCQEGQPGGWTPRFSPFGRIGLSSSHPSLINSATSDKTMRPVDNHPPTKLTDRLLSSLSLSLALSLSLCWR